MGDPWAAVRSVGAGRPCQPTPGRPDHTCIRRLGTCAARICGPGNDAVTALPHAPEVSDRTTTPVLGNHTRVVDHRIGPSPLPYGSATLDLFGAPVDVALPHDRPDDHCRRLMDPKGRWLHDPRQSSRRIRLTQSESSARRDRGRGLPCAPRPAQCSHDVSGTIAELTPLDIATHIAVRHASCHATSRPSRCTR